MSPDELERRLVAFFAHDPRGAAAVYLFGSYARRTAGESSDADVAILFQATPASTLDAGPLDLEGDLECVVQRPVDLIVLNRAATDLRARVLREGRLIFDGDPSARIRFEVQTRNEAFDFEPVLRQYRAPREPGP